MVSSLGGNFLLTVFPVSSLGQGRTEKGLLLNERCEKCKTATVSPAISKKQIFQVDLRVVLYSTVVFLVFFTPKSIFSLRLDSIFFLVRKSLCAGAKFVGADDKSHSTVYEPCPQIWKLWAELRNLFFLPPASTFGLKCLKCCRI